MSAAGADSSRRAPANSGEAAILVLVDRLGGCAQALTPILSRLPPTPLAPGGEAEAALLRHHLGASGKLREARFASASLRRTPYIIAPGEKIYMDPTVVPTLLSTRAALPGASVKRGRAVASGCSVEAASKDPPPATNALVSTLTPASLQAAVTHHSALCDSLAAQVRTEMAEILNGQKSAGGARRQSVIAQPSTPSASQVPSPSSGQTTHIAGQPEAAPSPQASTPSPVHTLRQPTTQPIAHHSTHVTKQALGAKQGTTQDPPPPGVHSMSRQGTPHASHHSVQPTSAARSAQSDEVVITSSAPKRLRIAR